jgi:hypothetical protein
MSKAPYAQKYTADKFNAIYPVEFVVRAFLGTYPELRMPKVSDIATICFGAFIKKSGPLYAAKNN